MKKPETVLVGKMMDRLEAEGGFWVKIHGGPFQLAGIPDIIGCWEGRFIGIEAKMPDNYPTKKQGSIMDLICKALGRAGVAYSVQEALAIRNGNINWIEQKSKLGLTTD